MDYSTNFTWRYAFNAKKSGILTYGESKSDNKQNAGRRVFNLGHDRVNERVNYDHVGVRACLYDDDYTGLEERLSKARRAFYSISGIGIRRKGLQGSTLRKNFISPAGLVTETFTSPEIFLLALILMTTLFK